MDSNEVPGIMSQIPSPLPADDRRRAFATTGGYVFQWWLTVEAWLELKDDEVLYVESSEDFEIVSSTEGRTVQAKAGTYATLTLRSPEVVAALNHFWQLAGQETRGIRFVFLAQATAGVEQGEPLGPNTSGLTLWMSASKADREKLRRFLYNDQKLAPNLSPSLREFVRCASVEDFCQRLVDCVVFDLGYESSDVVRNLVRERLVVLAYDRYSATVSEAERLADVLFSHVVHLAASKERIPMSRAQLLRKVEEDIVQSRQRLGLTLPQWALDADGKAAMWDSASNELALPPLPERIIHRAETVRNLTAQVTRSDALILVGSTGMGKTTLAKLVTQADSGAWRWVDLQASPPAEVLGALRRVLTVANRHRGSALNVVLDGFSMDRLCGAALNLLRSIAWLVRRRDGKVILTTQKPLTPTELASFGWSDAVTEAAPRMSTEEIIGLIRELGCADQSLIRLWAKSITIHSKGHPQLVHACALWLQRAGWPEFDTEVFRRSATSVELELAQARSLLARLSDQELELLTRLGVLGEPFRRDQALSLAEKLERLPGASFRFDALVGPWIEPPNALGYHRLSPLLESSPATVAVGRRRALEVASAHARLENRPVYFQDAAIALRHAFKACEGQLVAEIANKFLLTPHADRAAAFPALLWLMETPDETLDDVERAHVGVGWLLHLLRFQIAVTLLPAEVGKYLAMCEQRLAVLPVEAAASHRFVLLSEALIHCAKFLPAADVVRYIEVTTTLASGLGGDIKPAEHLPRAILPPSLRIVSDEDRVRILLAGLVLGQIAGEAYMADLVAALERLPSESRTKLVEAFGAWPTSLSLAIDKVWLDADLQSSPDWERLVRWYSTMASRSRAAKAEPFAVLFTRAASVVCNEYLGDQDRAARLLAEATTVTPSYAIRLLDQQAKIAAQRKQLPEALAAVQQALAQWEESEFEVHLKLFALQRAGTWAGKLERWQEAADHFAHGARLARKVQLVVNEAGLETDAAFARWQGNERVDAVDGFVRALKLCEKMPSAGDDLATYQFQKILGHILLRLAMGQRCSSLSPALAPVIPGMASEPGLNEKVKLLPLPQPIACKLFIAMIEHNHQLGETRWTSYRAELLASRSVFFRGLALDLAVRKAIQNRTWSELPGLSAQHASVLAVVHSLQAEGVQTEIALKSDDIEIPPISWAFDDQMCGQPLFLTALISAVVQGDDFAATLHEVGARAAES